jgi:hypothetical protein
LTSIPEINRIHLVLFGMQNRTSAPHLAAINRTLVSLVLRAQRTWGMQKPTPPQYWPNCSHWSSWLAVPMRHCTHTLGAGPVEHMFHAQDASPSAEQSPPRPTYEPQRAESGPCVSCKTDRQMPNASDRQSGPPWFPHSSKPVGRSRVGAGACKLTTGWQVLVVSLQ